MSDDKPKGRETSTGRVLEEMVLPALRRARYTMTSQTQVGCRPNGRKHNVDIIAVKEGQSLLISMKWQEASGTAASSVLVTLTPVGYQFGS